MATLGLSVCPASIQANGPAEDLIRGRILDLRNPSGPHVQRVSRKRAECCFESTVSEKNSMSLTEFWGKLGEFCEKFGEFVLAHK